MLRATAKMEGLWGNGVRLEVNCDTPNPGETFNLLVVVEEGGKVVGRETHSNLSMDPTAARYAPTLVTRESNVIDLALVGSPAGTFAGFPEARRPLGTSATVVQNPFTNLIHSTSPGGPRHSFDVSVDDRRS